MIGTQQQPRSQPGPRRAEADAWALVAAEMEQVEARLAERMESAIGPIPEVGAHLLAAGGKRLRPLLAVLTARATGTPVELAVAVGCAAALHPTPPPSSHHRLGDRRGPPGGPGPGHELC